MNYLFVDNDYYICILYYSKKYFIFYRDDGGFRATDENNQELQEIYFMGIIDIFTNYNIKKKLEHFLRSILNDRVIYI